MIEERLLHADPGNGTFTKCGLATVDVRWLTPAGDDSNKPTCPHCLTGLRHPKAPDRLRTVEPVNRPMPAERVDVALYRCRCGDLLLARQRGEHVVEKHPEMFERVDEPEEREEAA